LLSAGACGVGDHPAKYELAAVIEFIHTATLLHDDVVDESALRRGRQTANAMFGNAASVLVGDFLYSRAFQMMVDVGRMDIMRVLADATNVIAEGEVLQLMNVGDADTSEDAYFRVVRYKTAKLFEAAGRVGALLGDANAPAVDALARYGMHLGVAFQLVDDVLDYSGESEATGKNIGDDLAEGKATLPLIYAMRVGTAAQAASVRNALNNAPQDGADAHLPEVLAALNATDALAYTQRAARAEAALASDAIHAVAPGVYRDTLLQLAHFAVERAF
jgi:octaprenyl-diphosphate synthase